jgi:hypothetical protein
MARPSIGIAVLGVFGLAGGCSDSPNLYRIGGQIQGLVGSGLVLRNNGGDDLAVPAGATSFAFATLLRSGERYAVTVFAQPSNPSQVCTVSNGSGTVGNANVTNVVVSCATTYLVGGTITGLSGTGLVLRNNGGDDLTVPPNATSFTFPTPVASGQPYAVTVATQPSNPAQTCTVANGSGTVGSANVTSVSVSCTTNAYTVGGTVTGLSGTGLVLRQSGGDDLAVPANATTFTFSTPVASGQPYAVTVFAQPTGPSQTCAVTNGTGTIGSANVTNVMVTCTTNTYSVGGILIGLSGSGLVLRLNGANDLALSAGATTFSFQGVPSGQSYEVTVASQPVNPWQTCTVTNGTGTVGSANVTNVMVTCTTNTYSVGGTIAGLKGTGLVLRNHGGDDLLVLANATSFAFPTPVPSGQTYAVTVHAQPIDPWQTCAVTGGSGTVGGAPVTSVTITCVTNTYTVGGSVTGLTSNGLVLRQGGGDDLQVPANATTFTFSTPVASGQPYEVTVYMQPTNPPQVCSVSNGSGTITNGNITQVTVSCLAAFTVGGTITGLTGTGLVLQNKGGSDLSIPPNAVSFAFPPIASGETYEITVAQQPSNPSQRCTVANGTGQVTTAHVTNVAVTCVNVYSVGGTVSGLFPGSTLVLANGSSTTSLTANGTYAFPEKLTEGTAYNVTVSTQPAGLFCTVANGSGTMGAADVTNVDVSCVCSPYCPMVLLLATTHDPNAGHLVASFTRSTPESPFAWTTSRLSGTSPSGPALTLLANGQGVGLVRKSADDKILYTLWNGSAWTALAEVGPGITTRGRPSLAASGTKAQAIFHGNDYKHYFLTYDGSWSGASAAGSPQQYGPSAPVLVSRGDDLSVAYINGADDNRPSAYDRTGGTWQSATRVSNEAASYGDSLSPSLVVPSSGPELLLTWRIDDKSQVRFATRTAGTWSVAADANDSLTTDPVALLALPGGDVLMAFHGLNGCLYTTRYSGGAFSAPIQMKQGEYCVTLLGSPSLSRGVGGMTAELAFIGTDNKVYHTRLQPDGTWTAPVAVGEAVHSVAIVSGP